MTTIATDGVSIAGDGLRSQGDVIVDLCGVKVRRLKDGALVGFCGNVAEGLKLGDWLEEGGAEPELSRVTALMLHPNGDLDLVDQHCRPVRISAPAAVGTGAALALGAMLAGASPMRAVEIACERDTDSGGRVTVLKLEEEAS